MKQRDGYTNRVLFIIAVMCMFIGACCKASSDDKLPSINQTEDFFYVNTSRLPKGTTDIMVLNEWLRSNPNKKVITIAGVLAYREGVSGYIVYFESGDNSRQRFVSVDRSSRQDRKHERYVHGINNLQAWCDAHKETRIVSFTTVPAYSGGVQRLTICCEDSD